MTCHLALLLVSGNQKRRREAVLRPWSCHAGLRVRIRLPPAATWEHTIRDDRDFAAHMDYTHFNPVKHGLVAQSVSAVNPEAVREKPRTLAAVCGWLGT
jgi:REP element-mobilizing transposase RayT